MIKILLAGTIAMAGLLASEIRPDAAESTRINRNPHTLPFAAKIPIPTARPAAAASSSLFTILSQWTQDDLTAADALATSIPSLQDPVGKACWDTLQGVGQVVKAHPLPATLKLATDLEAARLVVMALKNACEQPQCTQMFTDVSNQVGAFLPIPVPLPSLAGLCAKIP